MACIRVFSQPTRRRNDEREGLLITSSFPLLPPFVTSAASIGWNWKRKDVPRQRTTTISGPNHCQPASHGTNIFRRVKRSVL